MRQQRRKGKEHRRSENRRQRAILSAICVALAAIMLGLGFYIAWWYAEQSRIRAASERYAQLYAEAKGGDEGTGNREQGTGNRDIERPENSPVESFQRDGADRPIGTEETAPGKQEGDGTDATPTETPVVTAAPTDTPEPTESAIVTVMPTDTPEPSPTPVVTIAPTDAPEPSSTPIVTDAPTDTPAPTETPVITVTPTDTPVPSPTPIVTDAPTPVPDGMPGADMPVVVDEPIPTPDADTLVLALPSAPPVQDSFQPLLALNGDTVGFLTIENMLALPVVHRENDNDYYLTHSFEGVEAQEGALFLDGLNRLVPEDDCLIVYGHNMKNDTMFGKLDAYEQVSWLKQHPVVQFDTLYENRRYVVFAGFTASMKRGDSHYFDVRNFIFDEVEFDKFVLKLQSRSLYRVPVEVRYGDRLLLLVTCDYTNRQGRFILALRQLRDGETEADAWAQVLGADAKGTG